MKRLFFRPIIFDTLRTYNAQTFLKDLGAGVTVGIIALPLALGFGIASGVSPVQGLWTAIIAGCMVCTLGGSRFQIAGPTGAFVPVLAGIVAMHGYGGLAVATVMAGIMLCFMGMLRLGALLRFIPYPVIAGFTTGISIIIFIAQLNEALGLGLKLSPHVPQQLTEIASHLHQTDIYASGICTLALLLLHIWPRFFKAIPAGIVAVVVTTVVVAVFELPVSTVQSKFGQITSGFPDLKLPDLSLEAMRTLMGPASIIAALGGIESLLSASVADGLTDTRHDSNQELIGQGLANIVCPLFGGIAATGAIARTAANIRSGGLTPISGLIHSSFLLLIALFAAPYAGFIPLATLSAILMSVALRMAEWENFHLLWKGPHTDFYVMLAALGFTVLFDLTIGVGAGLVMSIVLFVRRMEEVSHVQLLTPDNDPEFDGSYSVRGKVIPQGVICFRFHGPFFFAAADKLEMALRGSGGKPRVVVFRMRQVPSIDATGLQAFRTAVGKLQKDGVHLFITGIQPQPMSALMKSGVADQIGIDNFCGDIDEALRRGQQINSA